ncbi:hypothetical protein M5J15_12320 [Serratia symbiotica]|uniref:BRO-N domain-containing protein n=1 Tax=Serratia symbiotica TaxID=138074 RepID=UPI002091702F|nr:Bro-N domain-containing protein [Serratia symbiotica]USS95290.1 hypothetical protein M5J15_12320 [Serratia symbiotica]
MLPESYTSMVGWMGQPKGWPDGRPGSSNPVQFTTNRDWNLSVVIHKSLLPGVTVTNLSVIPFSFENHLVRPIIINDEPWFIASDIYSALKIANVSDALYKLNNDEKLHLGLTEVQKIDKMAREINIISESGMFTLVLRSRDAVKQGTLPRRFRKWVTGEVLPAIRKSGRYETLQYS